MTKMCMKMATKHNMFDLIFATPDILDWTPH